jgi:hypothetical protein
MKGWLSSHVEGIVVTVKRGFLVEGLATVIIRMTVIRCRP